MVVLCQMNYCIVVVYNYRAGFNVIYLNDQFITVTGSMIIIIFILIFIMINIIIIYWAVKETPHYLTHSNDKKWKDFICESP